MDNQKISIIIPVYNTGKYLKKCVDSVVNQTYHNLQILLIDDGSNDGTSLLCDEIGKSDSRIEVFHKQNEGLGLTRNYGLKYAVGDYVTFLDSDDWIEKDHIFNLYDGFQKNCVDLVMGTNTKCSNEGNEIKKTEMPFYGVFDDNGINHKIIPNIISASDTAKLDLGIPMSVCFNLYKLDIIKNNNLTFPSERYCVSEDFFFNYKYISLCQKVSVIKEYGYYYRMNPKSITHSFNEKQIERTFNFYIELKKIVKETNKTSNLDNRIYRCGIAKFRHLLIVICTSDVNFSKKIKYVKKVLGNAHVEEALNKYNLSYYRPTLRFISYCMKYKLVFIIYALIKLENYYNDR